MYRCDIGEMMFDIGVALCESADDAEDELCERWDHARFVCCCSCEHFWHCENTCDELEEIE